MQEHSGKNTNHDTGNRVRVITKELSCLATSHDLGTRSEKLKSEKEKVKEEANQHEANKNVTPLLGSMAAARVAHLAPGGVAILFSDIKVMITKVDRAGGTVLAAPEDSLILVGVDVMDFLIAGLLIGILDGFGSVSLSFKWRFLGVLT